MQEIELKFQVPAARRAALLKRLATASAETVRLRATYFDTADGALEAARLVLRLRDEGARRVQTLKGAGDGLLQRLEHEVVLPAGRRPTQPDPARHDGTEAGRALRAVLGEAALQPVHGTDIRRLRRVLRVGGARIEAAFDEGEVFAGGRRAALAELELELLDGPLQALLDLAADWAGRYGLVPDPATKSERAAWLRAGLTAPPVQRGVLPAIPKDASLGEARAAMVRAALAQALPNAAALASGQGGADHLHQLRVALRRLRSVHRALGPADPARDAALADLFGALGGRRDADVLATTLAPALAAAQAAGLTPVLPAAAEGSDPGPRLCDPATTRLWLALLRPEVPVEQDQVPWGPAVRECLRRWQRAARRQARAWATLDEPARHGLRKRLKRLRYLIDGSLPVLPARRARAELAALRGLQEALGHWNDLIVARATLGPPGDAAAAFVAGWLAAETAAADRRCAAAATAWAAARDGLRGPQLRG